MSLDEEKWRQKVHCCDPKYDMEKGEKMTTIIAIDCDKKALKPGVLMYVCCLLLGV